MKIRAIFCVKTKQKTARPEMKVPTVKGSLVPILSATHPQELSPITMPTMATESINPTISGVTPMDVR